MYEDFKEKVILVMQHPIMNRSPHDLTDEEKAQAYDLLMNLADLSIEDEYTKPDYIQLARIYFSMGELAYLMHSDPMAISRYFISAYDYLQKGGFDLSVRKWAELVTVYSGEG